MSLTQNRSVVSLLGVPSSGNALGPDEFEIFTASDLPAPSGGTITLPAGVYTFKADVTISDTITFAEDEDITIRAIDPGVAFTYSGVLAFFNEGGATTGAIRFESIRLELSSAGADFFDITLEDLAILSSEFVCLTATNGLGIVVATGDQFLTRDSLFDNFLGSLVVNGVASFASFNSHWVAETVLAGGAIVFDGTQSRITIADMEIDAAASAALNIDSSFTGTANLTRIKLLSGGLFSSGALDETSIYVTLRDSSPLKSSYNRCAILVSGNATVTIINVVNTYVNLNFSPGVALASSSELWELFTSSQGNIVYRGLEPFSGALSASFSVTSASGSINLVYRAIRNGSPLPENFEFQSVHSGVSRSTSFSVPITVVTNDTLRMQVKNITGPGNLTVHDFSLLVD